MTKSYPTGYSGEKKRSCRTKTVGGYVAGVEDVLHEGRRFHRVYWHRLGRPGEKFVVFEGHNSAAFSIYEQTAQRLRKEREPLIFGRITRQPNSKRSLGAKKYHEWKMQRLESSDLDGALSAKLADEARDATAMSALPHFGMF